MRERGPDVESFCPRLTFAKDDSSRGRRALAARITWMLLGPLLCFAMANASASENASYQRQSINIQRTKEAGQDSFDLGIGALNSRDLAGGQRHSYRLKLNAKQFALLVVDPTDIELVV